MTVRRWLYGGAVLLVLTTVAGALAAHWLRSTLAMPVVPGPDAIALTIAPGTSVRGVANKLAEQGGFAQPQVLARYAAYRGQADKVKAGEYQLEPGLSVDEFLQQVTRGEVVLHAVTVVEGWTFRQFVAALHANDKINPTLAGADDAAIMAAVGLSGQHPEGQFFPDTYRFARGTTDVSILRQAHRALRDRLEAAWEDRSEDCPLASADEALILASIIEKETARDDERRQIAGVFCRRLKRGMRLQTDPTVIYGLGPDFNGDITRRDLRTDTPYNTYTRGGLPPTPIALPGAASISAAVNPEDGDTLFFVATGQTDGSHFFSTTLDEHEAAVARYLKVLRNRP